MAGTDTLHGPLAQVMVERDVTVPGLVSALTAREVRVRIGSANTHGADLARRLLGKFADALSAHEKHVVNCFAQRLHVSRDINRPFGATSLSVSARRTGWQRLAGRGPSSCGLAACGWIGCF